MDIPQMVLGSGIISWISLLLTLAIGFAIRDLLTTFVSGFLFYLNRNFNEGDIVYLDGEECVIVKIGVRQTVFGFSNGRGDTWCYVYNDRIKYLKLEKVVRPKEKK